MPWPIAFRRLRTHRSVDAEVGLVPQEQWSAGVRGQGVEDMVCQLPRPIRPLAEAVHVHFSKFCPEGHDSQMQDRYMRHLRPRSVFLAAMGQSPAPQRIEALGRLSRSITLPLLAFFIRLWARQKPDNPRVHATMRRVFDHLLGPQLNADAADRAAKRMMVGVHPDRTRHLQLNNELQRDCANELFSLFSDVRTILQDPVMRKRIYAPHRLTYGQLAVGPAAWLIAGCGVFTLLLASIGMCWAMVGPIVGTAARFFAARNSLTDRFMYC